MMVVVRFRLLMICCVAFLASAGFAAAQECQFQFEDSLVESTGSQAVVLDADGNPTRAIGDWQPIAFVLPDNRVRRFGQAIGRIDLCFRRNDGRIRMSHCTGSLIGAARVLTAAHCIDPAGVARSDDPEDWSLAEARLLMGYDNEGRIDLARSYSVDVQAPAALAADEDALILNTAGAPGDTWGTLPLITDTRLEPGRQLMIVHHPRGIPKRFNPFGCFIHASQPNAPEAEIRHTCDTFGGSSGALILRASDLAILGVHTRGGEAPDNANSFNRGTRIAAVAAALGLTTRAPQAPECTQGAGVLADFDSLTKQQAARLRERYSGCPIVLDEIERLSVIEDNSGGTDDPDPVTTDATVDQAPNEPSLFSALELSDSIEEGLPNGWSVLHSEGAFPRRINALEISDDGTRLAVISGVAGVVIRDASDLSFITRVELPEISGVSARIPGTDRILLPERSGDMLVFSISDAEVIDRFNWENPTSTPSTIDVSPDGTLAALAENKTVTILDLAERRVLRRFEINEDSPFDATVAFTPDARSIVIGTTQTLRGYSLTGELLFERTDIPQLHWSVNIEMDGHRLRRNADGQTMIAGFADGSLHRIDPTTGDTLNSWRAHREWILTSVDVDDGSGLAVSAGRAYGIAVSEPEQGIVLWQDSFDQRIHAPTVAINPRREIAYFGKLDGSVEARALRDGSLRGAAEGGRRFASVTTSRDGKTAATSTMRGRVDTWDVSGPIPAHLATLKGLELGDYTSIGWDWPCCPDTQNLTVSDDGKLVAAQANAMVVIWNALSGAELARLDLSGEDGFGQVDDIIFVPGQDWLITSDIRSVSLHDISQLPEIKHIKTRDLGDEEVALFSNLSVSPDGKLVAGFDWEGGKGEIAELPDFRPVGNMQTLRWGGNDTAYSTDGSVIVSVTDEDTENAEIRTFDGRTGRPGKRHLAGKDTWGTVDSRGYVFLSDPESRDLRVWPATEDTPTHSAVLPLENMIFVEISSVGSGNKALIAGQQLVQLDLAKGHANWSAQISQDGDIATIDRQSFGAGEFDDQIVRGLVLVGPDGTMRNPSQFRAQRNSTAAHRATLKTLPANLTDGDELAQAAQALLGLFRFGDSDVRNIFIEGNASLLSDELRRAVQLELKSAGLYNSSIDGVFGRGTIAALESYGEQ